MRTILCVIFGSLCLVSSVFAQSTSLPSKDWMVKGFEAALADPSEQVAAEAVIFAGHLVADVPLGERSTHVVDRLLKLLETSSARRATLEALAVVPSGPDTHRIVDSLIEAAAKGDVDAISALGTMEHGTQGARIIAALFEQLDAETSNGIRSDILIALAKLPLNAQQKASFADALVSILPDRDDVIDPDVIVGPEPVDAVPTPDLARIVADRLISAADKHPIAWITAAKGLARHDLGDRRPVIVDTLIKHLQQPDPIVARVAANALADIPPDGSSRKAAVSALLKLFGGANAELAAAAMATVGKMPLGDDAPRVVEALRLQLKGTRRVAAAAALGTTDLGSKADAIITSLRAVIEQEEEYDARAAAATALATMPLGDRTAQLYPEILAVLSEGNGSIAAEALAELATHDPAQRDRVIDVALPLLATENLPLQREVAYLIEKLPLGTRKAQVIDRFLPLADPANPGQPEMLATLATLAAGEARKDVADRFLVLLKSENTDTRDAAIDGLATLGRELDKDEVLDALLPLLPGSRASIIDAIGALKFDVAPDKMVDALLPQIGASPGGLATTHVLSAAPSKYKFAEVIGAILGLRESSLKSANSAALNGIASFGPVGVPGTIAAIKLIQTRSDKSVPKFRAAAHIAIGDDPDSTLLLSLLGAPMEPAIAAVSADPVKASAAIRLIHSNWQALAAESSARKEAEEVIMRIIYAACGKPAGTNFLQQLFNGAIGAVVDIATTGSFLTCWTPAQRATIEQVHASFIQAGSSYQQPLGDHLAAESRVPIFNSLSYGVVGWIAFWAALLFAFPYSPMVQAAFFHNPKLREYLSVWTVPLLLIAVPYFRGRILDTFRDDLIRDANPKGFVERLGYFDNGEAELGDAKPAPLKNILPNLHGIVVVRGEAGLGKSSALRWLAINRPHVAFLNARDCAAGVDVAIAERIHRLQEADFIKSLVHIRALTVIIDGLNEVSAGTRENIGTFAREGARGDIFVGTQPIDWTEPAGSTRLTLQPLRRELAAEFLKSRPVGADSESPRHGKPYEEAVDEFLREALDLVPKDESQAAALMLSNPFDLSLAADLLANGTMPKATALIDEAFHLADTDEDDGYRVLHAGQQFPLLAFGDNAIKMRLEDRNWFRKGEFVDETRSLRKWRLVVERSAYTADGEEQRLQFRHDRVWDFFIAAAFRLEPKLWLEHLNDARFRGAYLRIAETWPLEDARKVGERLVAAAAKSGDHTTSDAFVNRLERRLEEEDKTDDPNLTKPMSKTLATEIADRTLAVVNPQNRPLALNAALQRHAIRPVSTPPADQLLDRTAIVAWLLATYAPST